MDEENGGATQQTDDMSGDTETPGSATSTEAETRGYVGAAGSLDSMTAIVTLLKEMEEQRLRVTVAEQERRERAAAEERARQREELERRERAAEETLARQAEQHAESMRLMQQQVEALRGLVESSQGHPREEVTTRRPAAGEQVKPAKLTDADDIEAYLTTFERMMQMAGVEEETWAIRLAPQLTGKAQQAYAAMRDGDSTDYKQVKEAILKRYNISEETYRQRFRAAKRKEGETYTELVVRLEDLIRKWTASCETIGDVREKFTVEQLLSTMPVDLRVWVSERKPATATEAGQLADDYLQARKQLTKMPGGGDRKEKMTETRKCHKCHVEGHLARNCPKK